MCVARGGCVLQAFAIAMPIMFTAGHQYGTREAGSANGGSQMRVGNGDVW